MCDTRMLQTKKKDKKGKDESKKKNSKKTKKKNLKSIVKKDKNKKKEKEKEKDKDKAKDKDKDKDKNKEKDKEKGKDKDKKSRKKRCVEGEDSAEEESTESEEEESIIPDSLAVIKQSRIPQAQRVPEKKVLPGAPTNPPPAPSWYIRRLLEEERPDLAGENGEFELEDAELDLLEKDLREHAELQVDDVVVNDDNYDDENRHLVRYEVQIKVNEGRYSAIYIVTKQIRNDNDFKDAPGFYTLKTGLRNGSCIFNSKTKREIRMLNELAKAKFPWAPPMIDSGTINGMPFIVMGIVDVNIEKLREILGGKFKPASAFYIAKEVLRALCDLHELRYVHRDVKPTNICVGLGPMAPRVFLIDYGHCVRRGKKSRYGTPDQYTLPYWSIDAHKNKAGTEKTDIEMWFYTFADLDLSDYRSNMTQSPAALVSIAETFRAAEEKVDVAKIRKYLLVGLQDALPPEKKYCPEWIKTAAPASPTAAQRNPVTT
ncbi:unnamed protein product [Haemonchus placei]|uniref:non-specific serine/threonine protein kinase n=1 Tax=Haemonchus placei TaxID=6290 RepID=A0A0N4WP50_HAEPC|nr:unnamed protein product [Haemonchus placei]